MMVLKGARRQMKKGGDNNEDGTQLEGKTDLECVYEPRRGWGRPVMRQNRLQDRLAVPVICIWTIVSF